MSNYWMVLFWLKKFFEGPHYNVFDIFPSFILSIIKFYLINFFSDINLQFKRSTWLTRGDAKWSPPSQRYSNPLTTPTTTSHHQREHPGIIPMSLRCMGDIILVIIMMHTPIPITNPKVLEHTTPCSPLILLDIWHHLLFVGKVRSWLEMVGLPGGQKKKLDNEILNHSSGLW